MGAHMTWYFLEKTFFGHSIIKTFCETLILVSLEFSKVIVVCPIFVVLCRMMI